MVTLGCTSRWPAPGDVENIAVRPCLPSLLGIRTVGEKGSGVWIDPELSEDGLFNDSTWTIIAIRLTGAAGRALVELFQSSAAGARPLWSLLQQEALSFSNCERFNDALSGSREGAERLHLEGRK